MQGKKTRRKKQEKKNVLPAALCLPWQPPRLDTRAIVSNTETRFGGITARSPVTSAYPRTCQDEDKVDEDDDTISRVSEPPRFGAELPAWPMARYIGRQGVMLCTAQIWGRRHHADTMLNAADKHAGWRRHRRGWPLVCLANPPEWAVPNSVCGPERPQGAPCSAVGGVMGLRGYHSAGRPRRDVRGQGGLSAEPEPEENQGPLL